MCRDRIAWVMGPLCGSSPLVGMGRANPYYTSSCPPSLGDVAVRRLIDMTSGAQAVSTAHESRTVHNVEWRTSGGHPTGRDTIQLEDAVSTISQEYLLDFTSEYGIRDCATGVSPLASRVKAQSPEDYVAMACNFQPYGRDFYDRRPTGRFSNGRIATDFISEALGIRSIIPAYLVPHYNMVDFVKGVSFSSAGTGYDNLTSAIMFVIPLWKELEYYKEYQNKMRTYLGAEKASKVLMEALYLISLGTNDFLENYYAFPLRSATHSIEQYENFLIGISRNFIIDLYNLGARKIAISGLPPMGCLPLQRTESFFLGKICIQSYNRVAREFNMKLQQVVLKLNQELGGIRLVYSDIYNILSDIIKNPKSFVYTADSFIGLQGLRLEKEDVARQEDTR
ncbi:GDSL esterase/lipase-like protein [Tanacetum coccineum]